MRGGGHEMAFTTGAEQTVIAIKRHLDRVRVIKVTDLADILAAAAMCEPHGAGELGMVEFHNADDKSFLAIQQGNSAVVIRLDDPRP